MSSVETRVPFKILYNREWRRISLTNPTFLQLKAKTEQVFRLGPCISPVFQYEDEENDKVALSSDIELAEAIKTFLPSPVKLELRASFETPETQFNLGMKAAQKYLQIHGLDGGDMEGVRSHIHSQVEKQTLSSESSSSGKADIVLEASRKALSIPSSADRLFYCQSILDSSTSVKFNLNTVEDLAPLDMEMVAPGSRIFKSWRVQNTGLYAWPEGSTLSWVSGDHFCPLQVPLPSVAPQEIVTVQIPLSIPEKEGRYVSYWRATLPDGTRFGHRMWCDIIVSGAVVAAEPSMKDDEPQNVQMEVPHQKDEKIDVPVAVPANLTPQQLEIFHALTNVGASFEQASLLSSFCSSVEEAMDNL